MRRLSLLLIFLGVIFWAHPSAAADATDYPNRLIRIIVSSPPGGGTDQFTRIVATELFKNLNISVIIENRPGANSTIGAAAAAKAPPDGYTLYAAIDSTLSMNQWLYANLPYDPNSFIPITQAVSMPLILAVNPTVKAESIAELVSLVKNSKDPFAYAYGAPPAQMIGEIFKARTGVDMIPVPYRGGAPAMIDVVGGIVPVIFDALGPAMSFVRSGQVRALALTGAHRSEQLPDIPTFAELGFPEIDHQTWIGFVAPAGVDNAIITKLNTEIVRVLGLPSIQTRLQSMGLQVVANSPQDFTQAIQRETVRFKQIIETAGIHMN